MSQDALAEPGLFVVTGGSRGIGAAIARMAARSYPVVIIYRSDSRAADAVVDEIHMSGGRASAVRADVGNEQELLDAFGHIDELGTIQALVNNAGVTGPVSRVEDVSFATVSDVFRTNVAGAFMASREAVRRMSTARGGRGGVIINISCGASQLGATGHGVHYAAAQGALDTMTVGLDKEVEAEGIRVNAVRPGL